MLLHASKADPAETLDVTPEAGADARYSAGDLIEDKYRLEKRLGAGGMGEVWSARSLSLDVDVAIKLIVGNHVDPLRKKRLLLEARVAARVEHPAVIRIFDSGTSERGDPYIVMELLRGESLADLLARDVSLTPDYAVAALLPIARALSTIHAAGIVHRDLKPDNVFMATMPHGWVQPKLLDFGIAKLEDPDAQRLTRTGALLGSPSYMAPEQARGEDADARSDLWACSAMLYRAVVGKSPFEGANVNALLYAIMTEDPDPGDAEVEAGVWAMICRGMQKAPSDRFASADELAEAMVQYLLERGVGEDVSGVSLRATCVSGPEPRTSGPRPGSQQRRSTLRRVSAVVSERSEKALSTRDRLRYAAIGGVVCALCVGVGLYALISDAEPQEAAELTWTRETPNAGPHPVLGAAGCGARPGGARAPERRSAAPRRRRTEREAAPPARRAARSKSPGKPAAAKGLPQFKDPFQ